MTNAEALLRVRGVALIRRWVVAAFVWFMVGSVQAEIRETVLDWEPACDGSSIKVTSRDRKLLLVEASAWHFAEAREWICVFKDGALLTATYRHYTLTRIAKGDEGEFKVTSTVDRVETFQAKDGVIQKVPIDQKNDLEKVLSKARTSLTELPKK